MNNLKETSALLQNPIKTIPQTIATQVKSPCTGFCYMIIQNKTKLISLFLDRDEKGYCDFISKIILAAAERKKNNKKIHYDGEYINQYTIKEDFNDIYNMTEFKEMNTADNEGKEYAMNTLVLIMFDMKINDYIIVTRSQETFVMFKISDELFLVVDSHKDIHGTVDIFNAVNYITRFDVYKGLIQLGLTKNMQV